MSRIHTQVHCVCLKNNGFDFCIYVFHSSSQNQLYTIQQNTVLCNLLIKLKLVFTKKSGKMGTRWCVMWTIRVLSAQNSKFSPVQNARNGHALHTKYPGRICAPSKMHLAVHPLRAFCMYRAHIRPMYFNRSGNSIRCLTYKMLNFCSNSPLMQYLSKNWNRFRLWCSK